MTLNITLELTVDQEERLRRKASRAGLDIAGYLKLLAERSSRPRVRTTQRPASTEQGVAGLTAKVQLTGAALVDDLKRAGVIGAGYGDRSIDAPDLAQSIRRDFWRVGDSASNK